ncbi:MAG: GTPase HflX, partial [Lewinella sp.]|nr:GTPase HflX [Lewinella sp.]
TPFLLSDTVGFIRKLPTHLIESFRSTLDEVRESDLLLHVVDIAHPQHEDHIRTVQELLKEIKAQDKPTLMVYNKIDLFRQRNFDLYLEEDGKAEVEDGLLGSLRSQFGSEGIFISAQTKENLGQLRETITEMVKRQYQIRYPYLSNSGDFLAAVVF